MPPRTPHCVVSLDTCVARGSIYFPSHSYEETFLGIVEEHHHGTKITNSCDYATHGVFLRLWTHYKVIWDRHVLTMDPDKPPREFPYISDCVCSKLLVISAGLPPIRQLAALSLIVSHGPKLVPETSPAPTHPPLWPEGYLMDRRKVRMALNDWLAPLLIKQKNRNNCAAVARFLQERNKLWSTARDMRPVNYDYIAQRDLWDRYTYDALVGTTELYWCNQKEEDEFRAREERDRERWLAHEAKQEPEG